MLCSKRTPPAFDALVLALAFWEISTNRTATSSIVRPGPYVNAEANAGGFPLWLTTGAYGELRDDDPRYAAAWQPYFSNYSAITSKHLVTNNGNTLVYQIENE